MNLVDAASFKTLIDIDSNHTLPTILYIKAKESDENPKSSGLSEISKTILDNATFISLESVQNGILPDLKINLNSDSNPDLNLKESLYLLCDHGHISELAALYLELAGFETHNIEGGLQALEAL